MMPRMIDFWPMNSPDVPQERRFSWLKENLELFGFEEIMDELIFIDDSNKLTGLLHQPPTS
jgi:hypothetical protein